MKTRIPSTWEKQQPLQSVGTNYLLFLWEEVAEADSDRRWMGWGDASCFYVNQGTKKIRRQEKCRSNFFFLNLFLLLSASLQSHQFTPASSFIWHKELGSRNLSKVPTSSMWCLCLSYLNLKSEGLSVFLTYIFLMFIYF